MISILSTFHLGERIEITMAGTPVTKARHTHRFNRGGDRLTPHCHLRPATGVCDADPINDGATCAGSSQAWSLLTTLGQSANRRCASPLAPRSSPRRLPLRPLRRLQAPTGLGRLAEATRLRRILGESESRAQLEGYML
jgi:hypothetical protein